MGVTTIYYIDPADTVVIAAYLSLCRSGSPRRRAKDNRSRR